LDPDPHKINSDPKPGGLLMIRSNTVPVYRRHTDKQLKKKRGYGRKKGERGGK
jgi:hypothetical protein